MTQQEKPKQTMQKLLENFDIKSFRYGDIIEGEVVAKGKNELLVDIGGKSEGIIAGKELNDDYDTFRKVQIGDKVLTFVIQAEDDQGYVVLSLRRAETERKWRELVRIKKEGKSIEVKVIDFNKGGLIVDVGAIRGFIPVSHIDRAHFPVEEKRFALGGRIERNGLLSGLIGKTLLVQVIEMDKKNNRLIFSEKFATAGKLRRKRAEVLKNIKAGDVVEGKISAVLPFGIFMGIDGIEGLVHISELSWEKVTNPGDLFNRGDKVKARVLEVDKEENRVSLSIKDLLPDPWEDIDKKYKIGDIVEGEVTKITPFGAFVCLQPGISGLIHISETVGPLNEGERVKVQIISIESKERKLGLSVKQLDRIKRVDMTANQEP